MKKIKLLSALTALTLTAVSAAPLFTNAVVVAPNYASYGNINDIIKEFFGEETVIHELGKRECAVFSPERFGVVHKGSPYLKVRLKKGSELNVKKLIGIVTRAFASGQYDDSFSVEQSDNIQKIDYSGIDYSTYYDSVFFNVVQDGDDSYIFRNEINHDVLSSVASVLVNLDDVVSVDQYNSFGVETSDFSSGISLRTIDYIRIGVKKSVNLDHDKYADYSIRENGNFAADASWLIDSAVDCPYITINGNTIPYSDFDAQIKVTDTDDVEGCRQKFSAEYCKDMYNTYMNLVEDYGEENVWFSYDVLESGGGMEMQTVGENLYTAAIKGDVNSDGVVDISDVVAVSAYVGDSENNSIKGQSMINGDVHNNGDGLTANDVLKIQQYLAGNIEEL